VVVVSPDDEDDPPPLQETARRLKKINVRKIRSFFIYFPKIMRKLASS
tara:strand:+ start:325 stop:468 length:144 start_codon:yes stop_codon:yes gene_type:complete